MTIKRIRLTTFPAALLLLSLLCSWQDPGSKVVAAIAEKHLLPFTKSQIHKILGVNPLAEVDLVMKRDNERHGDENSASADVLYLKPEIMNYFEFTYVVERLNKQNFYKNFGVQQKILGDTLAGKNQRTKALISLINLVTAIHQPLHISRVEYRRENNKSIKFSGKKMTFLAMWDNGFIQKQGPGYNQVANKIDQAMFDVSARHINSDPLVCMWETYQISSKIYAESTKKSVFDEDYYKRHIDIENERLELAGVHVADIINSSFVDPKGIIISEYSFDETALGLTMKSDMEKHPLKMELKDAVNNIGQFKSTSGKVYGYKKEKNDIIVYLGAKYPDQLLNLVLKGLSRSLVAQMKGKSVGTLGEIETFDGKPAIVVTDPGIVTIWGSQIKIEDKLSDKF